MTPSQPPPPFPPLGGDSTQFPFEFHFTNPGLPKEPPSAKPVNEIAVPIIEKIPPVPAISDRLANLAAKLQNLSQNLPKTEPALNPEKLLALMTPQLVQPAPKSEKPDLDQQKNAGTNREAASKAKEGSTGKEAVGADLVNIEVFKGEKSREAPAQQKKEIPTKEETKGPEETLNKMPDSKLSGKEPSSPLEKSDLPKNQEKESVPTKKEPEENQKQTPNRDNAKPADNKETPSPIPKSDHSKSQETNKTPESPHLPKEDSGKAVEKNLPQSANKSPENTAKEKVIPPAPEVASNQKDFAEKKEIIAQSIQNTTESSEDTQTRRLDKALDKERVTSTSAEDKYKAAEHPSGHRVMEYGRVENREQQQQTAPHAGGGGNVSQGQAITSDSVIPSWMALSPLNFFKNEIHLNKKGNMLMAKPAMTEFKISDLLFVLLSSCLSGAKTLSEAMQFIESRGDWFKVILGLQKAPPSRYMLWWFLSGLDHHSFEKKIHPWLEEVIGSKENPELFAGSLLPFISVWETPCGLIFGQTSTGGKNLQNKIMAKVLQALNLKNAIVVAQSERLFPDLYKNIHLQGGKYIAKITENDSSLDLILNFFAEASEDPLENSEYQTFEAYIEGIERSLLETLDITAKQVELNDFLEMKAKTFVKLTYETFGSEEQTLEERIYLSSSTHPADYFFDLFRIQKPVARKAEWLLNIAFRPASFDLAMQQCFKNLSHFQKYAKNMILRNGNPDLSIQENMKKAASDTDYLLTLIDNSY